MNGPAVSVFAARWALHTPSSIKALYLLSSQGSEKNQKKLGSFTGVETLLQVVARYRVRDPPTFEEREFMQNVFDLLCSVMLVQEHKVAFVKVRRTLCQQLRDSLCLASPGTL